jgi:glucose/arabinose dehydrogenase
MRTRIIQASSIALGLVLSGSLCGSASAQVSATLYASGFTRPTGMVQDPSNPSVQFVLEQGGLVKVIQNGALQPTPFLDLTSVLLAGGERGLLGLAFPRDASTSGRLYVCFTRQPDGHVVIARFRRSAGNQLAVDPASRFDLLWPAQEETPPAQPSQRFIYKPESDHNGGKIVFGPDGYLYIALGDGGIAQDSANLAQRPRTLLGKILRIDVAVGDSDPTGYRIPPDNPFVDASPVPALPEIWSFGWRNPWRMTFDDPARGGTGAMLVGDVGESLWEEIDYEPAGRGGRNYGWSSFEGFHDFIPKPRAYEPLTPPVFEYGDEFSPNAHTSVTGGYVYRGRSLGSAYRGRYFFADFVSGRVASFRVQTDWATGEGAMTGGTYADHTSEVGALGRISSIDVDAEGELYLVVYDGSIYRLGLLDSDADGLPNQWETQFGLSPTTPSAADDPDGDGASNLAEFQNGTHPRNNSTLTRYHAEGANSHFFNTTIAIANPGTEPAVALLRFLNGDGTGNVETHAVTVPGKRRITVEPRQIGGLQAASFSVVVETDRELIVERTMVWDQSGYGSHTDKATSSVARTWYFGEGSQGFFLTYLLLANPGATPNRATVRFLREGEAPLERTYDLPAFSRTTVDCGADSELVNRSFGMAIVFDQPAMAERAMYFGLPPEPLFKAGHESAGVTAPAQNWFLAEGATGSYFETFILAANPNGQDARATFTFLTDAGTTVIREKTVPANGRLTVNVEFEDPALANAAVATSVASSLPIIVERAQYWPFDPGQWFEAHNSFGVTATATRWGLAEGEAGGSLGKQTYILLANPNDSAATVSIEFLAADRAFTQSFGVPARSRFNVSVGAGLMVDAIQNERFGAVITSDLPIAVERAIYGNVPGQIWGSGSNATATQLSQ